MLERQDFIPYWVFHRAVLAEPLLTNSSLSFDVYGPDQGSVLIATNFESSVFLTPCRLVENRVTEPISSPPILQRMRAKFGKPRSSHPSFVTYKYTSHEVHAQHRTNVYIDTHMRCSRSHVFMGASFNPHSAILAELHNHKSF